jgi:hypothetical protein
VTATASSSTGTAPFTYQFDFGDGATASSSTGTATHAYTAPGTYTLSVRISDAAGQAATPDTGQIPFTATLDASGSSGGTGPYIYTFDLGNFCGSHQDQVIGPQSSPTATYDVACMAPSGKTHSFPITLTVKDATGATATATGHIAQTDVPATAPTLTVTPTSGTAPLTVTLQASGATAGGAPIDGYDFTEVSSNRPSSYTADQQSPTLVMTGLTAGTYTFYVTASDQYGVESPHSNTVTVTVGAASSSTSTPPPSTPLPSTPTPSPVATPSATPSSASTG